MSAKSKRTLAVGSLAAALIAILLTTGCAAFHHPTNGTVTQMPTMPTMPTGPQPLPTSPQQGG